MLHLFGFIQSHTFSSKIFPFWKSFINKKVTFNCRWCADTLVYTHWFNAKIKGPLVSDIGEKSELEKCFISIMQACILFHVKTQSKPARGSVFKYHYHVLKGMHYPTTRHSCNLQLDKGHLDFWMQAYYIATQNMTIKTDSKLAE